MRAVFQTQPEVAHVYLGSKRHVLETDLQRQERAVLAQREADRDRADPARTSSPPTSASGSTTRTRGSRTTRWSACSAPPAAIRTARRSSRTSSGGGSRQGTTPTWRTSSGRSTQVLRSEHNHFSRIWDDATHNERLLLIALAQEPAARLRRGVPQPARSSLAEPHPACRGELVKEEVVGREPNGSLRIVEPFFAEWVSREQAA